MLPLLHSVLCLWVHTRLVLYTIVYSKIIIKKTNESRVALRNIGLTIEDDKVMDTTRGTAHGLARVKHLACNRY